MSITFFVSGEAPQKKVYAQDQYPSLEEEYFADDPYFQKDEVGYYTMESAWPELNVANGNALIVFALMGISAEADDCGTIANSRFPAIRRNVVKSLNTRSKNKHVCDNVEDGNITICGVSLEQIERYCTVILSVIECAQENNRDISWG